MAFKDIFFNGKAELMATFVLFLTMFSHIAVGWSAIPSFWQFLINWQELIVVACICIILFFKWFGFKYLFYIIIFFEILAFIFLKVL